MKSLLHRIIIIFLTFLAVSEAYPQETLKTAESQEQKFARGAEFYSNGDYKAALEEWISIYNTGSRSAALEYNIGNGCFKLNNIPGAILYYERALLYKPADEDIRYNLQIARTMVVDKFEEIPELFFVRWYNFLALSITSNGWAKISLISFILSLLMLSLYIYSGKFRLKVLGFWAAVFLFVLTLSSLSCAITNKSLVHDSHKAIIFSPLVSGKSSPDNSGTDLFVLHEGTKVAIEDEVGEWYEIRLSDGNKGWVPANCLNII